MKTCWRLIALFLTNMALAVWPALADDQQVDGARICIDTNFWAPYTFAIRGHEGGLHVEIAKQAFAHQKIAVTFQAAPWNRCIADGRSGTFDAVLSAGFNTNREGDFLFPADAASVKSRWRVTQVDYVVVVRATDMFDWDGADATLPQPVGLPLGYAEVDHLRDKGIAVTTATKYGDLFRLLARRRVNSLILPRQTADMFLVNGKFETELALLARPLRSTSYFLMVARKGKITPETAQALWDVIALIRENEALMAALLAKVQADLAPCQDEVSGCTP